MSRDWLDRQRRSTSPSVMRHPWPRCSIHARTTVWRREECVSPFYTGLGTPPG